MDLLLTDPDRKVQMKRDIERKKENGKERKKKSDNFIHAAKRKKLKSKLRLQGQL